jgi:hypothetical protein
MYRQCLTTLCSVFVFSAAINAASPADTSSRNSLLYNGIEYTGGYNYFNELPYFQGVDFLPGDILYTGNLYRGVELQYDCIGDAVLLKDPIRSRKIQLIKDKVDEFTVGGHHFVKVNVPGIQPGFYEQLYKGKRSVLVLWKKNIVRDLSLQEKYVLTKTTYLLDGIELIKITKATELTKLMGDKKRKVQQYYRESNLSFKSDPETATFKLVQKAEAEGW